MPPFLPTKVLARSAVNFPWDPKPVFVQTKMRCLTVKQPYASAIAYGVKRYEVRTWQTSYRGPLVIHAGAGSVFFPGIRPDFYARRSQFVAICTLSDCLRVTRRKKSSATLADGTEICDLELDLGGFYSGDYAWQLSDVQPLETNVRITGRLSLWRPTSQQVALVSAAQARLEKKKLTHKRKAR
jgi:activating signal cointegrator 1